MEFELFKIMQGLKAYYEVSFNMSNDYIYINVKNEPVSDKRVCEMYVKDSRGLSFEKFKEMVNENIVSAIATKDDYKDTLERLVKLYEKATTNTTHSNLGD